MATYLHPGVYVEEIPSGAKPIEAVGTSTAAFVGYAVKGEIGEPTLLFTWDAYVDQYGGIRDTSDATDPSVGDPMGFSVRAFFQNGGSKAYITRLARSAASAEGYLLHPDAPASPGPSDQLIKFTAANEGTWGESVRVTFAEKDDSAGWYVVVVGIVEVDDDGNEEFKQKERFRDLSMDSSSAAYIESKINDDSDLIRVEVQDVDDYLLGTSTSESSLDELDLTTLNGNEFNVQFDGSAQASHNVTVTFADDAFAADDSLTDVADAIETAVRTGVSATSNPRTAATCEVSSDQLVLTSGTRLRTSAVTVTAADDAGDDAAVLLTLGADNSGEEVTGAEALDAILSEAVGSVDLEDGNDGDPPEQEDYETVWAQFLKIRDINIICVPDQVYEDTGKAIIDDAISHAERMRDRMVILDVPGGTSDDELTTEAAVNALSLPTSTYTVLYYPRVKVANPNYDSETNPGVPRQLFIPPSGYAAGMWAKIDGRRGTWKAPAGTETGLLGLDSFEYQVEDDEQDQLNPLGVNCLRKLPGFGPVIWGARTLSTKAKPEWRYVPVRRTAILIEQSIYNGIQWAVFEPNDHRLWASLRLNIDSFMNGLFRAGAFQGEKASDAYYVRCGLGDTMTQADIDRGQVIVIVGFAPLKPAEFVIVRIQQKVGQE